MGEGFTFEISVLEIPWVTGFGLHQKLAGDALGFVMSAYSFRKELFGCTIAGDMTRHIGIVG